MRTKKSSSAAESCTKRKVFVILPAEQTDTIPVHDHWWF
jgi:hypothetical protein